MQSHFGLVVVIFKLAKLCIKFEPLNSVTVAYCRLVTFNPLIPAPHVCLAHISVFLHLFYDLDTEATSTWL